jgi:two-component system response regulator PrrA
VIRGERLRWSVVVVGSDPDVRALVETMFDTDERFEVVASVGDVGSAIGVVAARHPDAVILDLHQIVPGASSAITAVHAAGPNTRIVAFSEFADPMTLLDVLGSGADHYLDRGRAWQELVGAVVALCRLGHVPSTVPADPSASFPR